MAGGKPPHTDGQACISLLSERCAPKSLRKGIQSTSVQEKRNKLRKWALTHKPTKRLLPFPLLIFQFLDPPEQDQTISEKWPSLQHPNFTSKPAFPGLLESSLSANHPSWGWVKLNSSPKNTQEATIFSANLLKQKLF